MIKILQQLIKKNDSDQFLFENFDKVLVHFVKTLHFSFVE